MYDIFNLLCEDSNGVQVQGDVFVEVLGSSDVENSQERASGLYVCKTGELSDGTLKAFPRFPTAVVIQKKGRSQYSLAMAMSQELLEGTEIQHLTTLFTRSPDFLQGLFMKPFL